MRSYSKLTAADVAAIRGRLVAGERVKDIAADYKVHPGHISRIKHSRQWRDRMNEILAGIAHAEERERGALRRKWDRVSRRARAIANAKPGCLTSLELFHLLVGEGLLNPDEHRSWYSRKNRQRFAELPLRRRNIDWPLVRSRAGELARTNPNRTQLCAALQQEFPTISRKTFLAHIRFTRVFVPSN